MIKRTVEISRQQVHVSVRLDQLRIEPKHASRQPTTNGSIPCEDIGVLLVDNPAVTYSHAALAKLVDVGAVVVICGRDHLPAGLLLPMSKHSEVVWRIDDQIAASKPLHKRLWKQIVIAKIRAQADNLPKDSSVRGKLLNLARQVRSGDPSNVEANAARLYWSAWMPRAQNFRRDPDGDGINALLNYGYATMRAAVARALVAAGLLPALGIKHSNRSNAFCLADDLVEPLRPIVDARVRILWRDGHEHLDQQTKARLLELLTCPVRLGGQSGPLMVALHRMTASLVRCYHGVSKTLDLPVDINRSKCY